MLRGIKTIVLVYGVIDETAADHGVLAEELRLRFAELCRNGKFTTRSIQYVDRSGIFY
jgi:hypothetical protein